MNRSLLLGLGLGVILAAALVFSWRASQDEPVSVPAPVATTPAPSPRSPGSPRVDAPPPSEPERIDEPHAAQAPHGVTPAPETGAPAAPANAPPVLEAESPFAVDGDSRELDYAFELVFGPDSGVETAKSAAEVFERCLKQVPSNRRCYDGLLAAQQRQSPDWQPPPPPSSLAVEKVGAPREQGQPIDKRRNQAAPVVKH